MPAYDLLCMEPGCTQPAHTERAVGMLPAAEIEGHIEDAWFITELVCSHHGVQ